MEEVKESKIKFFLEPIKRVNFDDPRNPSKRKNLKFHNIYSWLLIKIISLTLCLPIIAIISFLNPKIFSISLPSILVIIAYILKLKILFQRVTKKIITPLTELKSGDFVACESGTRLNIYVIIKRSMSLYYLKSIEFKYIFSDQPLMDLSEYTYTDLKIVKSDTLCNRYMRVVPISTDSGSNRIIKNSVA
jgi:hypothetical protein